MPAPPPHDSTAISCPHCGYDLRAHVGDDDDALVACPECGEQLTAGGIRTLLRERALRVGWRNWLLALVPAFVGAACIPPVEARVSEQFGMWLLTMFMVLSLGYLFLLSYRFWRPHPALMSFVYAAHLAFALAIVNIIAGFVFGFLAALLHFLVVR